MLKWFTKNPGGQTAQQLYGSIVTRSRSKEFYTRFAIADTIEGRFEVITAHHFIVLQALRQHGDLGQKLSQLLIDRFFEDIDDNLREMGVGDITVPKKMHKFADAFYGRISAYDAAMQSDDRNSLHVAIARNIFNKSYEDMSEDEATVCRDFATYLEDARAEISSWPLKQIQDTGISDLSAPAV